MGVDPTAARKADIELSRAEIEHTFGPISEELLRMEEIDGIAPATLKSSAGSTAWPLMISDVKRSWTSRPLNESGRHHPDATKAELGHVGNDHVRNAYHAASYRDERVSMAKKWAGEVMKFGGQIGGATNFSEVSANMTNSVNRVICEIWD